MKTISDRIFANDTQMAYWQQDNCMKCAKAVWYNEQLGRCPQYKCALQRDMEMQAAGQMEVNERSYKMCHGVALCPCIKTKDIPTTTDNVLVFSEGKSMIQSQTSKPDDCECSVVDEMKAAEKRMYDTIFEREISPKVVLPKSEEAFRKKTRIDVEWLAKTFTHKENVLIVFAPLIISQLAWMYSQRAMTYCAERRIPDTIKLSRAVKHIREEYIDLLRKDLDGCHIRNIENQTNDFASEYAHDFNTLWYCVNQQYMTQYPNEVYKDMKTDAYIGLLMCRFLVDHNKRMDKIIESRMGKAQSIKHPIMSKLEACLDAYCGDQVIERDANVNMCLKILEKNISEFEFEVEVTG